MNAVNLIILISQLLLQAAAIYYFWRIRKYSDKLGIYSLVTALSIGLITRLLGYTDRTIGLHGGLKDLADIWTLYGPTVNPLFFFLSAFQIFKMYHKVLWPKNSSQPKKSTNE